jgi:hypothetical protein
LPLPSPSSPIVFKILWKLDIFFFF